MTNNNNLSKRLTLVEDQDAESLFDQLKTHLLLNLSRCQRKLSDWDGAVESATQVIEEVPPSDGSHLTALQARAKAYKESGQLDLACRDLTAALQLSPNNRDLHRMILKVNEEMKMDNVENLPIGDEAEAKFLDDSETDESSVVVTCTQAVK